MTRYGANNWDTDLEKASEDVRQELEELVPMYQELAKVHLLQSLVSRILVDMVFGAYYVGLSDAQGKQFNDMEETLLALGEGPPYSYIHAKEGHR